MTPKSAQMPLVKYTADVESWSSLHLTLREDVPPNRAYMLARRIRDQEEQSKWHKADLLRHAELKYGDMPRMAAELGLGIQTALNMRSIARIPVELRRDHPFRFHHHAPVAQFYESPRILKRLLDNARTVNEETGVVGVWTVAQLWEAARATKYMQDATGIEDLALEAVQKDVPDRVPEEPPMPVRYEPLERWPGQDELADLLDMLMLHNAESVQDMARDICAWFADPEQAPDALLIRVMARRGEKVRRLNG